MEQIPKIARERLRGGEVGVSHPDADVLTAFSEQALPERERGMVLEHLARCGDCRDVLALALPEAEVPQAIVQPSPRSWFAWPSALRWGFVAAGIAIVATFGTIELQNAHHSVNLASREQAPILRDEQSQPKAAPAAPAPGAPKANESTPESAPDRLKSEAKNTPAAAPAREPSAAWRTDRDIARYSANLAHGPRVANQMQLNSNLQQQNILAPMEAQSAPARALLAKQQAGAEAKKTQVPSTTQTVEVAPPPPVGAQGENTAVVVQSEPIDKQTLNGGQAEATADATRPSVVGFSTGAKVATRSSGGIATLGGPLNSQSARWTINSSGGLQRSTDQGKSWQDMNVGDSSSAASGMVLAVNGRPKELDKKDAETDKVERSKAATPVFRAVSANGPDVWAGASSGMLYHSTDAGGHWTRVIPASSGASLTGEILTVTFSDLQHGRVTTSTSEVWTTQDDGQTWQRR